MKKIIYFTGIIAITLVLFSCKSTKKESDVPVEDGVDIELQEEVEDKDKEDKKESSKKESSKKKNKKSEDKEDKENKEETDKVVIDKGYLGWISSNVKNPVYEDGLVKIKTDSKLGTFGLFVVNEEGKSYPVISTLNEYSSSGFQIKVGRRIYKLISSKNVKVDAGEIANGVCLFYDLKNMANVIIKFEAMPSLAGNLADTIKITAEVKNVGKKTETFALKTILDTVLGEKADFHFYKSDEMPIKRELSTRNLRDDSWFISKNTDASMQVLVYGGDITTPSLVALANYDTLSKMTWEPNMLSERVFDTVLSYNNSAIGIIWPEVRLEPNVSKEFVFYISLGLYGTTPNGHYFIKGVTPPAKQVQEKNVYVPQPVSPVETPVVEAFVPAENVYTEPEVPNVEFNINKIPKDHLTNEYVQSLISRIDELEQSGKPVNPNEILQLKAEIDAILSILRQ